MNLRIQLMCTSFYTIIIIIVGSQDKAEKKQKLFKTGLNKKMFFNEVKKESKELLLGIE